MHDKVSPYKIQDGSFLDHPSMQAFKMSPLFTNEELADLWEIPHHIIEAPKDTIITDPAKDSLRLCVLTSGWLYSYTDLPEEQRQVHRIYQAGDFIGDADYTRGKNMHMVKSATDCRVAVLDTKAVIGVLTQKPELLNFLAARLSLHYLMSLDHTQAVGHLKAKERMVHFILTMLANERWNTNQPRLKTIKIPLSQAIVSDYLGLTSVHVSRTLPQLEKDGFVRRTNRQSFEIIDEKALIEMSGFVDRHVAYKAEVSKAKKLLALKKN